MAYSIDSKLILDTLDQNIFVKDINSTYLFANDAYAALVGIESSSIIGKNDLDFFPKEIAEKYRADDANLVKNKKAIDITESIIVDGNHKIVRTIKKPLYLDGEVIAILGIFWDVTALKEEREHLKKLEYGLNKAQQLANIGHWELNLVTNILFGPMKFIEFLVLNPKNSVQHMKHF